VKLGYRCVECGAFAMISKYGFSSEQGANGDRFQLVRSAKEYGWSYDVPTIRISTVQPDLPF